MIAAAFGALLFTASQAAYAAPSANFMHGAVQSPTPSVDLVREGGGGKGGGPGMRAGGGGGPKFSGGGGGPKMSGPRGGPKMGADRGGPKMDADRGGRYAGKGPRGGDWDRGGKRGGYAWKGDRHRHYGRYLYPGIGLGLAYGAYAGDECGWLYRRARATGSPYWWQRFEECRYSYY
jgi:hypothetical protein